MEEESRALLEEGLEVTPEEAFAMESEIRAELDLQFNTHSNKEMNPEEEADALLRLEEAELQRQIESYELNTGWGSPSSEYGVDDDFMEGLDALGCGNCGTAGARVGNGGACVVCGWVESSGRSVGSASAMSVDGASQRR